MDTRSIVQDLVEDDIDIDKFSQCIEIALVGLSRCKSKEGKYLSEMLDNLRDECDCFENWV